MKRIIITLLCFCMLFGNVVMAKEVTADEGLEMKVVTGLGIVDKNFGSDASKEISRAEFVDILVNLIEPDAKGATNFTDISDAGGYAAKVRYAADMGYVNGYPDGSFKPSQNITVGEAAIVIMRVAGYDALVKAAKTDEYQTFLKYAAEQDLTKGLNTSHNLTADNTAKLLYNMLSINVVKLKKSGQYPIYGIAEDETFMGQFMNLYKVRGIITANPYTTLMEPSGVGEKLVQLNGVVYSCDNPDVYEYLGYNTESYIYANRSDEKLRLAVPYRTEVTHILSEDILIGRSNRTEIRYEAKGGEEKVKIEADADIIHNGQADLNMTTDQLLRCDGELFFIDNDADGKAEVVVIYNYQIIFADGISVPQEKIYNKFTYKGAITELSVENRDFVVTENGKEALWTDIEKDDVLMVKSTGNIDGLLSIKIVSNKVEGKISGLDLEDGIVIDGVLYPFSKTYNIARRENDFYAPELAVGFMGTFYLDDMGRVVAVKQSSSDFMMGFLKNAYLLENGENSRVRLLSTDQEWYTYDVAEKVNINAVKLNASKILSNTSIANNKRIVPQLIRYKLNSDGEIYIIQTAEETMDVNVDFRVRTLSQIPYRTSNASFDSTIYIDRDTVLFDIPAKEKNSTGTLISRTSEDIRTTDEDYFFGDIKLKDWDMLDIKAYNFDCFGVAEVIVVDGVMGESAIFSTDGFIFDSSLLMFDSDGETRTYLRGVHGTNLSANIALSADCEVIDFYGKTMSVDDLVRGDLLSFESNIDGEIAKIHVDYKEDQRGTLSNYTGSLHADGFSIYGNIVKIDSEAGMILLDDGAETYKSIRVKPSDVMVYSVEGRAINVENIMSLHVGDYIHLSGYQSSFGRVIKYQID